MTDWMSEQPAVEAVDLTKCYRMYRKPHHRLFQALRRGRKTYYNDFAALSDVSFSVPRGRTLGIIGLNGSGKSTLLQMIAGVLRPTSGRVTVCGRVAALLELGAGFNPELTGRQNAEINAMVLGIPRPQVQELLPSIIEFSGLKDFIDQPLKTYSSGMAVRLAFSVATSVDPDVLLVDEAIAVGDAPFQVKCYRRIRDFKESGRTILVVSHDTGAIQTLCDHVIILHRGRMYDMGESQAMVQRYLNLCEAEDNRANVPGRDHSDDPSERDEDALGMRIVQCLLNGSPHQDAGVLMHNTTLDLTVRVRYTRDIARPIIGYQIHTASGFHVMGTNNLYENQRLLPRRAGEEVPYVARWPVKLAPNRYTVTLATAYESDQGLVYSAKRIDRFTFRVASSKFATFGVVDLDVRVWEPPASGAAASTTAESAISGRRA